MLLIKKLIKVYCSIEKIILFPQNIVLKGIQILDRNLI